MRWIAILLLVLNVGCVSRPSRQSYGVEALAQGRYAAEQPIGEVTVRLYAHVER